LQRPIGRFPEDDAMSFARAEEEMADRDLDITGETCPMTFVRVRLALDRMAAGQVLRVRLKGEEPLRNVPRTAAEQGHAVLRQEANGDAVLLWLRKGG
jgi:TusA-related sulfurtransferase